MKSIIRCFIAACAVLAPAVAFAISVLPGDIVTPQSDNNGTVIVVHPSGDREVLSLYPSIGSGPAMSRPTSIARMPGGNFLVTDTFVHESLTRIDVATGNRTDVSLSGLGTGPWATPNDVLITNTGNTLVVFDGFVAQINLANGNRTVLSGLGVGSGPNFTFGGAGGSALDFRGHVIIGVHADKEIFDIDPTTGARTILSGPTRGAGPTLTNIMDLVVLPSGQIIVEGRSTSPPQNTLFSVDPTTGDRTAILSEPFPNFEYERMALGANGHVLASSPFLNDAIFSVNPATGARTLISGLGRGTGPSLFWGDMVLVTPEPSSAVLLGLCSCLTFATRRPARRSKQDAHQPTHRE
jgi:hypothetical protein